MRFSLLDPAFVASLARATLTPTQALVASFAGTGLLDALLVFDPPHYTTPGSAPGSLVDALGGPITYAAPNTQATPAAVPHASGYSYVSADGVDDTLIASANQTVAWYCAVFRSRQSGFNTYCSVFDQTGPVNDSTNCLGLFGAGSTQYWYDRFPRGVRKSGVDLASPFDLGTITQWMTVSVHTQAYNVARPLQLLCLENYYFGSLELAALAIRYTDPTAAQQTQIESRLMPVQQALLASA